MIRRTAIVITHFRQSGYLLEAVTAATAQHALVVVVDDHSPATVRDEVAAVSRLGIGTGVVFLQHRTNRGPSAARNTAIRWLLRNAPDIEFILPLDGDDLIEGDMVARLEAAFDAETDPHVGWLSGDGVLFGTYEAMARMPRRFSRYRLSQENLYFVTSCIRRAVFEQGVFYDERLDVFEDWEFYLHAMSAGWKGRHIGDLGFHYRKHGVSRLTQHRSQFDAFRDHVALQYPELFGRGRPLALEHDDLPRFAVVDLESGEVTYLSSPDLTPTKVRPGDGQLGGYRPPVVIAARSAWLAEVRNERTWHQVLSLAQMALRERPYLALGWHHADRPNLRGLVHQDSADAPAGIAIAPTEVRTDLASLRAFLEGHGHLPEPRQLGPVVTTVPHSAARVSDEAISALAVLLANDPDVERWHPDDEIAPADQRWAHSHNLLRLQRTELRAQRPGVRHVGIAVPWIGLGGMDIIMLEFARALAERPAYRVHLISTLSGVTEMNPKYVEAFTTINPIPDTPGADLTTRAIMAEMDILLIANSESAISVLHTLPAETRPTTLVFIQNVDIQADGASAGYLFPMARQYERFIDGYVVPSHLTADMLASLGVPPHKQIVVPNAAAYRPDPEAPQHQLVTGGRPAPGRPMRLLFAGRFDRQKGMDRLVTIIDRLRERGVEFELRLVGKALLEADPIPGGDNVSLVPPSMDEAVMREHFSWADCLVLPSRWEGFPLVMLDAMAFGLLVVTSDVGGTPEYVADGDQCVLVEDALGDEHVITRFVDALAEFATRLDGFDDIRRRGQQFSDSLQWPDLTDTIERFFEPKERY